MSRVPRSPRIVPGGASAGFVGPIRVRTIDQTPGGPPTTITTAGERVMNSTSSPKNGFSDVLRVVRPRRLLVDLAQLARDQLEAFAFQPSDDLSDKAALDGIGLTDDEGPIHGRRRLPARHRHRRDRANPPGISRAVPDHVEGAGDYHQASRDSSGDRDTLRCSHGSHARPTAGRRRSEPDLCRRGQQIGDRTAARGDGAVQRTSSRDPTRRERLQHRRPDPVPSSIPTTATVGPSTAKSPQIACARALRRRCCAPRPAGRAAIA